MQNEHVVEILVTYKVNKGSKTQFNKKLTRDWKIQRHIKWTQDQNFNAMKMEHMTNASIVVQCNQDLGCVWSETRGQNFGAVLNEQGIESLVPYKFTCDQNFGPL
jgi:hypothetical protein